jgi:hypothetical protein
MYKYKQFNDLTIDDLNEYPIWEFVPEDDQNAIDETTIKGYLAYSEEIESMIIVRTKFILNDGSIFYGYVSPEKKLELSQPALFVNDIFIFFWHGLIDSSRIETEKYYKVLDKKANDIFPVKWVTEVNTDMINNGEIEGFGFLDKHDGLKIKYIK